MGRSVIRRRDEAMHRRTVSGIAVMILVAGATVLLPASAIAREWRGHVSYRGTPAVGAMVNICGISTKTNNSGRFQVTVQDKHTTCSVSVTYSDRTSTSANTSAKPYLSLTLRSGENNWVLEIR